MLYPYAPTAPTEGGGGGHNRLAIKDLAAFNTSRSEIADIPDNTLVSFVEMASVSNDGYIANWSNRQLGELRKGSYTYFRDNDILLAKITPCMENGKCAIAKGLTNGIGLGSTEFHTIRCTGRVLPEFLFGYLNRESIRQQAAKQMTGASGHRRVPVSFYENMMVPVPAIEEQAHIVSEVQNIEKKIEDAKTVLASVREQKEAILNKWLQF